jgi:hypothetical protein
VPSGQLDAYVAAVGSTRRPRSFGRPHAGSTTCAARKVVAAVQAVYRYLLIRPPKRRVRCGLWACRWWTGGGLLLGVGPRVGW